MDRPILFDELLALAARLERAIITADPRDLWTLRQLALTGERRFAELTDLAGTQAEQRAS